MFQDESNKTFVGRFLLPHEILPWLEAQRKPSWAKYICTHHTYSPTYDQWKGLSTLKGIFNYYKITRGWTEGKGPHFWVAPREKGGPVGVWIGTHPSKVGIGAAGWNSDTLHCEYAWNGDIVPFSDPVLTVGAALMGALNKWLGIPLEPVDIADGYAVKGKRGHLFHRDARNANKSCPGNKNTHANVISVYKEKNMAPVDDWTSEAKWLREKGIVNGFPDGTYRPTVQITRGQMAIALKRFYEVIEKEFQKK